MIEADRLITANPRERDEQIDRAIRPLSLADYIGQPSVREQMELFIQAARGRQEALDHTLIFGPPGLGKTTLANIIAQEMGVSIKSTSGPVLERPGDLAAMLTLSRQTINKELGRLVEEGVIELSYKRIKFIPFTPMLISRRSMCDFISAFLLDLRRQ